MEIDLTGYKLYDSGAGTNQVPLERIYTADSLSKLFIEHWIGYTSCYRKCGKSDYCKYASQEPYDVQCGVAVAAINNFVSATFNALCTLTPDKIQNYLDGAFYFCRFILEAEYMIGFFANTAMVNNWTNEGKAPHVLYGSIDNQFGTIIDKIGKEFSKLDIINTPRNIIFVEGESEQIFISKLNNRLEVFNYAGKGNTKAKRIAMTLKDYNEKGYKIWMHGDADGSKDCKKFNKHIEAKLLHKENTFLFRYNFETSVPLDIAYQALQLMNELTNTSRTEFLNRINGYNEFTTELKNKFKIDLKKTDFAKAVAEIIAFHSHQRKFMEEFMKTELGCFFSFIHCQEKS